MKVSPLQRLGRDDETLSDSTTRSSFGLTVRVGEIDANDRVHFSVIEDREAACAGPGEMSYSAFVSRFTRIDSVEDACARIKHLGYVASRRVRIYGEEFELLSDPFPEADRIAICAKGERGLECSDITTSSDHRAKR